MNLRKHAYISSRGFEYRESGQWRIEDFDAGQFSNADALFARIYSANRAIWILSEDIARDLRKPLETPSTRFEVKRSEKAEAYLEMSERISFKPQGAADRDGAQVFFPEKAEAWGIDLADDDAEVIERATMSLQEHFGRSLVYPPGRMSIYLMEGVREKANEQVQFRNAPASFEMFQPVEYLDWCKVRSFTEAEKGMRYIHAFDKNAMYLNAVGIPLGLGTYRHVIKPEIVNRPGVWRVRSVPFSDCALFNPPGSQNEWVCTSTLLLLQELGLLRDLEEAYICDEAHKLFPTYYSHLKKALTLAASDQSEAGKLMTRFIKMMYVKGIGYLNSDLFKGEWFHRPDWWATVVSEAGARAFRDALQVRDSCGLIPVATHIDCLYYVSDEPDAYAALPIFKTSLANKFKHKGTCEVTPEMISAFDDGKGSGEFAGMFKRETKARERKRL